MSEARYLGTLTSATVVQVADSAPEPAERRLSELRTLHFQSRALTVILPAVLAATAAFLLEEAFGYFVAAVGLVHICAVTWFESHCERARSAAYQLPFVGERLAEHVREGRPLLAAVRELLARNEVTSGHTAEFLRALFDRESATKLRLTPHQVAFAVMIDLVDRTSNPAAALRGWAQEAREAAHFDESVDSKLKVIERCVLLLGAFLSALLVLDIVSTTGSHRLHAVEMSRSMCAILVGGAALIIAHLAVAAARWEVWHG